VKEKISHITKGGAGNEKRNALRAELDSIRGEQSSNKSSRGKVLDQLKSINEGVQKKVHTFTLLKISTAETHV
jgi:hypothetical protein